MLFTYFNRDISWLGFNERVLMEASSDGVPLYERIKFLSIYSSNLDEFYRVRIPTLGAIGQLKHKHQKRAPDAGVTESTLAIANEKIATQLSLFGDILRSSILPGLLANGVHLLYDETIPDEIQPALSAYFYAQVLSYLQPVWLDKEHLTFFPENNKVYLFASFLHENGTASAAVINVPAEYISRFYAVDATTGVRYIVFLEDIIQLYIPQLFADYVLQECFSFKVTRDAELDLQDEFEGDLAGKIEDQIKKRDYGLATRVLYDPSASLRSIDLLVNLFGLANANLVAGGRYHNLKDLADLPLVKNSALSAKPWALVPSGVATITSVLEAVRRRDILLHLPYQSYDLILRFFNEAAINPDVTEVYVTLYRVASDSHIVHALISAARNGKRVTVFIELKARFDEANNLHWSKEMKAAGVKIIYSIPGLKVHAKTALVKQERKGRVSYLGLLATGNFNERTARFYTDHVLLTARPEFVRELELLFLFLQYREPAALHPALRFQHLLVAQFNLKKAFLDLIDGEIAAALEGKRAQIKIKLNNLEEKDLIAKLYEASQAGVDVELIVRSICCLIPGIEGMSERIRVTRLVDRHLEHARIFIFHNDGNPKVFMGSADWMNRNIYRRIEVCFPVLEERLKEELIHIVDLQLQDNEKAVGLDSHLANVHKSSTGVKMEAQAATAQWLYGRINAEAQRFII